MHKRRDGEDASDTIKLLWTEKAESTVNFQLFLFMAYFLCTSVVQSCMHVHYGM